MDVRCPGCGAHLRIDLELGKVISHEAPARHATAPDLEHVGRLLDKEKARREALFRRSTEEEKVKSQLLERKFEEALKRSKDEPITAPQRDIDLD